MGGSCEGLSPVLRCEELSTMLELDSMTVLDGAVNVWGPTLMVPPPSIVTDASGDAAGGRGDESCDIEDRPVARMKKPTTRSARRDAKLKV